MEQKRKQICYRGVEASGSAWHYANDMDEIITAGHYSVCLSHDNLVSMGIVTAPCDAEHKVVVQLIVTESAIANKQQHGRVVGQTLVFAACDGATVEILNRTAEKLENGFAWQQWNRMSQKIEVGEVTSLDDCTESGTYNGVFTNGQNKHETFIMVVINNAPVAEASGKVRCISQFKYALGTDSNFSYKTRTGRGDDDIEWGDWVDLGAATTTDIQDGAITAHKLSTELLTQINNNTVACETETKRALQAEANAVDKGKQLALRALFVAAGAEYNDTDTVLNRKNKFDADWNETIEHLPHCYCLNGLGDISEEEMLKIYNVGCFYGGVYGALSGLANRTNLGRQASANFSQDSPNVAYACQCTTISLCVPTAAYESSFAIKSNNYFYSATKLRAIYGRLTMDNVYANTFKGCASLERVKIHTTVSVSLADSPLISKQSLLYVINKANPSSAITITLHPDAYARLKDDTEILSALTEQPLITLVSV